MFIWTYTRQPAGFVAPRLYPIDPTGAVRGMVATKPVDFRKGVDGYGL